MVIKIYFAAQKTCDDDDGDGRMHVNANCMLARSCREHNLFILCIHTFTPTSFLLTVSHNDFGGWVFVFAILQCDQASSSSSSSFGRTI